MVAPMPPAATAFLTPPRPSWRALGDKVTFIKTENNPEHDCLPFGAACCFSHGVPSTDSHRLLIHHSNGTLAGSIPWRQAETLYRRFQLAMKDPALCAELKPKSFEEELCLLLTRYRSGETPDDMKKHRALPALLTTCLQLIFTRRGERCTPTERFASPLNVHFNTDCYYSLYARDALFGARCDAYSCQWAGASIAHPEPETAAMAEALRWAIKSAAANPSAPVLTVLAMPSFENAPHAQLLSHRLVQKLITIPSGHISFTPACYTNLGKRRVQHSYTEVDLLLVANPAGLAKYYRPQGMTVLSDELKQLAGRSTTWEPEATEPTPRAVPATVSLAGAFMRSPPEQPYAAQAAAQPLLPLVAPVADARHLKWASAIAYTDGSADKAGIAGAGVVFYPAPANASPRTISVHIGPGRALTGELVGISTALRNCRAEADSVIATDCLTAMGAIENGLYDSDSMTGHAEERELRLVVKLLRARTAKTTLIKVKAHVGITGNELADKAANAGRTNTSHTRLAPPATGAGASSDDEEEAPKLSVVVTATGKPAEKADLTEIITSAAVKKITDKEQRRIAAGEATGQSIPARWFEASAAGDYVDPTSFGFDKARLSAKPTRTMNRIRMQQFPRNFKKRCEAPGCGKTVYNLVHGRGACMNTQIRNLITDCTNDNVHIIAGAVSAGNLEQCALLVNAGTKYASSKHEDYTIPAWALPGRPSNRGFPDKPDIVVIKNWQRGAPPPTNAKRTPGYMGPTVTFLVCEHMISADIYLADARDMKRSIYVELVLALLEEGWAVELCESVRDHTTWYKQWSFADEACDPVLTAARTPVDATEHDDSDIESSDSDDEGASGGGDANAEDPQSQPGNQRARAPVLTPARLIPLEEGELRFPIYTIIVGQIGTHLESSKLALSALGIPRAQHKELLLALSTNAVQRTHHCLATYKHLCRTARPAKPQPSKVVRPPSTLRPQPAGVG